MWSMRQCSQADNFAARGVAATFLNVLPPAFEAVARASGLRDAPMPDLLSEPVGEEGTGGACQLLDPVVADALPHPFSVRLFGALIAAAGAASAEHASAHVLVADGMSHVCTLTAGAAGAQPLARVGCAGVEMRSTGAGFTDPSPR